jgi:uncharacterized protein YndB with AHSA1/START domain
MPRNAIVIERILPAAPAVVFECWSDADSMAQWMCPSEGMTKASVRIDFRVGGRFEIVMHGQQDFHHTGEFLAIEPDRLLVFTWVSAWMIEGERTTSVRVDFEPAGDDETRLVLTHSSLPDSSAYDGHEDGWGRILQLLSEAASNRGGEPR